MTEAKLLELNFEESSVHAFDVEGEFRSRSAYSSCSCINPPCPISNNK